MDEQVNEKNPCEHELEYISRFKEAQFYSDDGDAYYIDIALYKCKKCGELELDFY